jgi:nucleoside 2-deoxyribosyltransferase
MKSMESRKVFISHSAADAEWARSFAKALKDRGVAVWFDEFEAQPDESWRDALEEGLRSSDVLVALLDRDSSSKPNLFFELGAAIGMGKKVVPIVPKGIDPGVLPLNVRLRRYLIRETPEQTAEELSHTLQAA